VPIRVFLSYSHHDKTLAGKLKTALEEFGIKAFLAHDDITPSAQWKKEILANLRKCRILMPIVTKSFKESEWTDQEAGVALGLNKTIFPLKVRVDPHGFLADFHALTYLKNRPFGTCWRIVEQLSTIPGYRKHGRDCAITFFLGSNDFVKTRRRIEKLIALRPFSAKQLAWIITDAAHNQNIYGCHAAESSMNKLLSDAKGKVSDHLIRNYRRAVKDWPW
jgi:hypothetical protein